MSRHRRRGQRRQRKGRWLAAIVRAYTLARVQTIRDPSFHAQNIRDGLREVLVAWLCTPEGMRTYPRPRWWPFDVPQHLVEDLVFDVSNAIESRNIRHRVLDRTVRWK